MFGGCPACAQKHTKAPVEVRYDYDHPAARQCDCAATGLWRWRALLPRIAERNIITLGEGNTPLLKVRNWSGPAPLYLKNETASPTWSYKDRANSVSISMAREFGFSNVVAVSTGNHGNAAAAYSSAAGNRCVVFCHQNAPELQLALMGSYGATVVRGGRQDAMVRALVARGDWFPSWIVCPRAGFANPFGIEGFKTIAFEIYRQFGKVVPDRVFVPVGSGDGIYGIWKGFVELQRTGQSDRLPRMYACQATGANPYVRAFRDGKKRLTPVERANTVALSIEEKIGGELALGAVYESGGAALNVTDDEMLLTARCLAREGLALEPASAAAVACASKLMEDGCEQERWVAIGTGAAIKWPQTAAREFVMPEKLPPDYEDVSQLIPNEQTLRT